MEYVWFPLFVASVLAFVGFRQWLRHQQRAMVHRERLAALDKGANLPAWPDESPSRFDFGLDSILLLSGLIWLAIGLGGMFAYDLYLYADGLLFQQLDVELWSARGAINALIVPMFA